MSNNCTRLTGNNREKPPVSDKDQRSIPGAATTHEAVQQLWHSSRPVMSSSRSSKSSPNSPQTVGGIKSQSSKTRSQGPLASKSDWLAPTIVAARMITAASECLPFPYVKSAFGMVVILLETVEVWSIVIYVEDVTNPCQCRK
jgi:hypothetical protein